MAIIIAEMSGNHRGDLGRAVDLIWSAKAVGCDAIKIQTYKPDDMPDQSNRVLYEKCAVPLLWYPVLFHTAAEAGIPIFASIFNLWAIDFLEKFNCCAYKFAARGSTELPLKRYERMADAIKSSGKTFIVSASKMDVEKWARPLQPDVILYCPYGHPPKLADADFNFVSENKLGFSDHTPDIQTPLAMISAGATHIEKHFKLFGDDECIDARFSADPAQMSAICAAAHK